MGTHYLARQMPNSYIVKQSAMPQAARGRRKKINQKLRTPVITGSGESDRQTIEKQYYVDPKAATEADMTNSPISVQTNTRSTQGDQFWRQWKN